jgi:ATP-dependent Clp protease ATP-binding subunit ClpA
MLEAIFDKLFEHAATRFRDQGITVEVDATLKSELCRRIVGSKEGARPLERAIEDVIVAPLVDKLLDGEIGPGQRVVVGRDILVVGQGQPKTPAAPMHDVAAIDLPKMGIHAGALDVDPEEARNRAVLASRLNALNAQLQAQAITLVMAESALELLCSPFWLEQRGGLGTVAAFAGMVEQPLLRKVQADEFQPGEQVEAYRDFDLGIAFHKPEGG